MQSTSYHGVKRRYKSAPRNNMRYSKKRSKKSTSLDPKLFIHKAIEPSVEIPYMPRHSFATFGLNQKTSQTLKRLGFDKPTAIQDQTIPLSLAGEDVIGLASTGTGKTASFLLPIINKLSVNPVLSSSLILAPTRELAKQIDDELRRFSFGQRIYSALLIGGADIRKQIRQIERGPHIIIATPGRALDLIKRNVLDLSKINTFVLDEADRMCDMGFEHDIRTIESKIPKNRQTLCFSATITSSVQSIISEFMQNPITISVVKSATNEHIEQNVVYVSASDQKIDKLVNILSSEPCKKAIIFGETKFGVQRLADRLTDKKFQAIAIHGNKTQAQRERALRQFKDVSCPINILVATDVAARGLDVPDVTHVINFDPPKVYDDYVHRIGRTGRAGKTGTALTFVLR